jgi:uncharacterized protein (TIGR00251 family)
MPPWCRRLPDGALSVSVHAQPGAKRTGIAGLHGEALKVRVAAPAQDDRANEALVEFLAAVFRVPRRDVRLASGARSREKRFEVRGSAVAPESVAE